VKVKRQLTKGKSKSAPTPKRTGVGKGDRVVIPTKPSIPSANIGDYSFIFMGERGIGKTTLAAEFDKPLFFMFEPGATSLSILQIPRAEDQYILTWGKFIEALDELEKVLQKDPDLCHTIVIDTGYMAYERCYEFMLDKLELDDPRDKGWGNGWKMIEREFREAHYRILHQLNLGLVVITHTEIQEITTKMGNQLVTVGERLKMQLGKQAFKLYKALMDVEGYIGPNHMMRIKATEQIEAKNRISGRFLWPDGTAIEEIPLGTTPQSGYKAILSGFNNKPTWPRKGGKTKSKR